MRYYCIVNNGRKEYALAGHWLRSTYPAEFEELPLQPADETSVYLLRRPGYGHLAHVALVQGEAGMPQSNTEVPDWRAPVFIGRAREAYDVFIAYAAMLEAP